MPFNLGKKYFDGEVSHGFVSLYTGKVIIGIATRLLGLFLPIFLFTLFGQNFQHTMMYYGAGSILYGTTLVYGAKFLSRFGFRRALRWSVFAGALYFLIFYFIDKNNLIYLIPLSLLFLTLFRLLYWIPYHTDFAKFTDKKNRGKQLSSIMATRLIIGIFAPIVAGLIISRFGFDVLFIIAIIIYLISGVPYLTIPRTNEKFSWGYMETWKKFFSKERRGMILAYMADGAETVVGWYVWPIFIFLLLKGDYFQVGAISTLIIAVTAVSQLFLGKYIDQKGKKGSVLRRGSVLYALGWIVKIFISTAFHIFIVGAYHSFIRIFTRTSFDAMTYEIAADNGHYVDEFTVLKETAVHVGKILMVIAVIAISYFVAIQWTFILAAIAALFLNLLHEDEHVTHPIGV
jgi:MFS family permease